jgi:hypothetical protein
LHDHHLRIVEVAYRCRHGNPQSRGDGVRVGDWVVAVGLRGVLLECVQYGQVHVSRVRRSMAIALYPSAHIGKIKKLCQLNLPGYWPKFGHPERQ